MADLSVLHIDTAYTLRALRAVSNDNFFLARNASGLFREVWSVHPLGDPSVSPNGGMKMTKFSRGHFVIEGKIGLCRLPRILLPLNFLISQIALYRLLVRITHQRKISVVVGVDPFLSGLIGLAVAKATGKPFVLRISGNHDEIYDAVGALAMPRLFRWHWIQKAVERFVLKRADLVAAINHNNLAYGVTNGARKKTAIIPISGNIETVHREFPGKRRGANKLFEKMGVPVDNPKLLYFGRLIQLKHPEDALRAMATVISDQPRVHGIIAGCGVMENELISLAQELGVYDSVSFVGQLDQRSLALVIPKCIVLSPSAGQMALLESALGGAPIVTYDRDFQSEFIQDGVNGFIVPFRDWRSMAARVSHILEDPILHERLSKCVRRSGIKYLERRRVRTMEWAAFAKILDLPQRQPAPRAQ